MRSLIAAVVLLVMSLAGSALAEDPPGGKRWYQVIEGFNVSTTKGMLLIAADTPGFLVSTTIVAGAAKLNIRFERGIAVWLGQEITSDSPANADTLTITVAPSEVRALLRQSLSRATPAPSDTPEPDRRGGAEPGALGALGGTASGVGGGRAIGVQRDTLTIEDTLNVGRREAAALGPIAAEERRPGPQVFPPSAARSDGGPGKPTRVIAREEHDAWLLKVLGLLDEDGARCETKGYGPGWISVCESRHAA